MLFGVLAFSNAHASVGYCIVKGYVQLDYVSRDWIEGKIGEESVGLAYYQSMIYGRIQGDEVRLTRYPNNVISGTIGRYYVEWYADNAGHIFGYQPCLFYVSSKP